VAAYSVILQGSNEKQENPNEIFIPKGQKIATNYNLNCTLMFKLKWEAVYSQISWIRLTF